MEKKTKLKVEWFLYGYIFACSLMTLIVFLLLKYFNEL